MISLMMLLGAAVLQDGQGATRTALDAIDAAPLMLALAAALGLSLFVERVIELFKNGPDIAPTTHGGRVALRPAVVADAKEAALTFAEQTAAQELTEAELEAKIVSARSSRDAIVQQLAAVAPAARPALEAELRAANEHLGRLESDGAWDERSSADAILVAPATRLDERATVRTLVIMLLALATGILAARVVDVRLYQAFGLGTLDPWADYLLTGLFIGGGSAPVHVLMRFLSARKMTVPQASAEEPAVSSSDRVPAVAPVVVVAASPSATFAAGSATLVPRPVAPVAWSTPWIDIPYDGGYQRDRLEHVHKRGTTPVDTVIYHHTAMNARSTFQDVVRVIQSRKDSANRPWITGYNCVILADGSMHAFCRWDRYGNHAAGFNRRSLGITFNGNFETDASVPFSNPDGRYGASRPTEVQLDAGARVVALWSFLYPDVVPGQGQPDFAQRIIPHRFVSAKTCPGNNFPEKELQRLVQHYRALWAQPGVARDQIEAFKQRPYLT